MVKKITRTFKSFTLTIKDGKTGEVAKTYVTDVEPKREKVAIAYIKETKNTNFTIEITETEELREMSLETFIVNSTIVVPK